MSSLAARFVFSASLPLLCAALATGCDDGQGAEDDGAEDSTGTEQEVGFLEVGFGETDFKPIEDGGELHVVWGAQGSAMFPMPIRGGEFTLPDDPQDYTDERAPLLDVALDVDGEEPGYCGHFKCVSNYPISFEVRSDGVYEFIYVRVIMPDGVDPADLDGKSAHLRVELSPFDSAPLVEEFDLTITVDPPPF